METESSMSLQYSDTGSGNNIPAENKSRMSQVQLSPEELRILRECNRESFYYRCLPFALTGIAATYIAFQKGILTGHPRWGPAFKMTGAAFAGWILGKLSYRTKCEDKFLHVQNSAIADVIRKKRGYIIERFDSERSQYSGEQDLSLKDDITSSGDFHSSSGSLNFDKNVPYSELDDRQRPSLDNENDNFSQSQPGTKFTTYDELRKRNREDYERQQRQPDNTPSSRRPWNSPTIDSQRRTNMQPQDDSTRNAYGDSWDNAKFK